LSKKRILQNFGTWVCWRNINFEADCLTRERERERLTKSMDIRSWLDLLLCVFVYHLERAGDLSLIFGDGIWGRIAESLNVKMDFELKWVMRMLWMWIIKRDSAGSLFEHAGEISSVSRWGDSVSWQRFEALSSSVMDGDDGSWC
jgi:hypothetical protein